MPAAIDITGQRFGAWTALGLSEVQRYPSKSWDCVCDCGTERSILAGALRRGDSTNCGCLAAAAASLRFTTHGMSRTPEYRAWNSMQQRCYNPKRRGYDNYGGRGITVCDEWLASFEAFFRDVGPRPSPEHSIDRINSDGNYEPGNVRWATVGVQNRNTSRNRMMTHDGRTQPMQAWAEELGLSQATLSARINTYGWSVERALTTPKAGHQIDL